MHAIKVYSNMIGKQRLDNKRTVIGESYQSPFLCLYILHNHMQIAVHRDYMYCNALE